MNWPDYFPEDCPPDFAEDANLEAYRLVDQDPPSEDDFIPHKLLYPDRRYPDECKACGLSVFTEINDFIELQRRVPALRGSLISVGNLTPEMGKILPTPYRGNSHHSWWIPDGMLVAKSFNVVSK
jgi:hypothetical protein